jgi:hypothetical protein
MGTGTNVQARAVGLHHLDCPWRPADLTQRDGRALRRGNQYSEIGIYRYVVEGSFDAYLWQTVARKARFIAQLMRGRLDGLREIEDIGDSALSYNEVKALAAGNPLLLDKAKADNELTRLERLERSHVQTRSRLRYSIEQNQRHITRLTDHAAALEGAIAARRDTRADKFAMTIEGRRFTDRAAAGHVLRDRILRALDRPGTGPITLRTVATLGGHSFDATIRPGVDYIVRIVGIPDPGLQGSAIELADSKPAYLAIRMENRLTALERLLEDTQHDVATCHQEITRAEQELERPFAYTQALTDARDLAAALDQQLNSLAAPVEIDTALTTEHNGTGPETSTPAGSAHPALIASAAVGRAPYREPPAGQTPAGVRASPRDHSPAPERAARQPGQRR